MFAVNTASLTRTTFDISLDQPAPPTEWPVELAALWWLQSHNWQVAHNLIDQAPGQQAARVHALLHRMEGDLPNARYWYARAGVSLPELTIGQEIEQLLTDFLTD